MAQSVLLATQLKQDFIGVPASQNVWLAGMAEGLLELGYSVHIPWAPRFIGGPLESELELVKTRFHELYGVRNENLEFFDAHELAGPSVPRRFDVVWARDAKLLNKSASDSQMRVAEYHGGAQEKDIPELTSSQSIPLVTVTETWAQQFGASAIAEPGALKVFYLESKTCSGRTNKHRGIYAGGLDPDRIDGVGVRSLRQILSHGSEIDVVGGNLGVEVDILRWRLGKHRTNARFFGYVPPAVAARLMHSSDFSISLKSEKSSLSAPLKLIAFAAAKLPMVVSPAFSRPDFSGKEARALRTHSFVPGANPQAAKTVRQALAEGASDIQHNFKIALDNTYARRIEKTQLLDLIPRGQ